MTTQAVAQAKSIPKSHSKTSAFIKRHDFLLKLILISLLIILTVLSPGGWALAYKNKIYPNVTVAGVKVGGLTIDQAKQVVESRIQELKNNGPILVYQDQKLSPTLDELGVSFNSDTAISAAFNYGRNQSLKGKIISYFKILENQAQVNLTSSVDPTKTQAYVDQLASKMSKPAVNASISVVNGQVTVTPEQPGLGFDSTKVLTDINNFINQPNSNQTITLSLTNTEPQVLEANTTSAVGQTNNYLAASPITFTYSNKTWTADRAEIGQWMKYSVSGNNLIVSVDPSAFIKKISDQVSIPEKDTQIQDGTGQVLDPGQDGLSVDSGILTTEIKNALASKTSGATIAVPAFAIPRGQQTVYPDAMPGRYPGHYIDINLSQQRLYAFDGETQVNTFLISSGIPAYPTPTGEFYIYSQSRVTEMKGPGYDLPGVQWVSWFDGDYGIHGTYWHHNFGHVMSHGCINATNADAEWVYGFVQIGTPVYIHY